MPDTHTAFAQELDRYAAERMAATAAAKAKRLWPDVIGEVLADEIMALLELPLWLRSQSRTQQLITPSSVSRRGSAPAPAAQGRPEIIEQALYVTHLARFQGGAQSRVGAIDLIGGHPPRWHAGV